MLRALVENAVDFVIIGGVAGSARGSAYVTQDIDIANTREPENLERLAAALNGIDARLRNAPADLPFRPDAETLAAGAHVTFDTKLGPLDLLDRPDGSPQYGELLKRAGEPLTVDGVSVAVASIDDLIAMKEATGRPRDALVASELRMLADEIRKGERG
jgi:predicted nucleotidyltransferase